MKTDRRHELQTNVLADWIGKHLQQSQGYAKTILAVILLVAAAATAGMFLVKDQAARAQASWNQFFQAFSERDPDALEAVASANQGTTASVWAHLAEADLKLAEGIGDLYTNRENAKRNLAQAEQNYLAVERVTNEQILRERAWFGLGQTYESLAEIDKAQQFYGKLVSSAPTSALGREAKRRFDALDDAATAKWYNWFANQTPRPPAMPDMSGDLGLPNFPSDLGNLADRPDLPLPGLPTTTPATEATGGEPTRPTADSSAPATKSDRPSQQAAPAPSEAPEVKTEDAASAAKKAETPPANQTPAEASPSGPTPKPGEPPATQEPAPGKEEPE